jgi:cell division protein FtsL
MDLFVIILILAMMLIIVVVFATLYVQQSGHIHEMESKLAAIDPQTAERQKQADALRRQRLEVVDPLMLLEAEFHQGLRKTLDEMELQHISEARDRVLQITQQLRDTGDWLGPPYDLEWVDYFDRLPEIKAVYMKSAFGQEQVQEQPTATPPDALPPVTSGN